ncbi:MAG TPA: Hsp20/alpha crystallin family protein [Steroidobacteraceae bacterium]|nr:Hsp20/alpha crystallin family protein [Steroidobacteraceae bacterium]
MTTNQDVATPESAAVDKKARERETVLIPAVDIFEDAHQITVKAEMPGVSKDKLIVQADRNGLLIEGDMEIDMPAGMTALYADLQSTRYRRSFVLSGELETERIEASLKDGLLTVRIPKRVEFRTRKIKVNVP